MGETGTTKEVDVKAIIEESRKMASAVFLRISNEPKQSIPTPPLSREIIINDGGDVCMNCRQKDDYDVNMLMCPCFAANPSPQIPKRFPKKENQIPCLIYLLYLREGTSASDLYKLFSDYGPITKAEIPTDKTTGLPEDYGLVTFENVDDAERALNALNEQGHFVEWFDWYDSIIDINKCAFITSSSPSNTSSSQG